MQFVVFEKFTSAYLLQISCTSIIMWLLVYLKHATEGALHIFP